MFGPLLTRELLVSPRHLRHYGLRAGYPAALAVLMWTAFQNTIGWQQLRNVGDIAQFGSFVFELILTVQLALVMAGSLMFSAGAVAQEKDRRTLILLLMTDLSAVELVLGRMLAALLPVFMLIAVSLPVLCCVRMLGGVGLDQILWAEAICLATALVAGAWGTLVAYWREKTFQTLSITVLGGVLFIGAAEAIVAIIGPASPAGRFYAACDPFRALNAIANPLSVSADIAVPVVAAWECLLVLLILAATLCVYTCLKVRIWNPSREVYHLALQAGEDAEERYAVDRPARPVWTTPIIWREICTQAYGKRVGFIKLAYYVFSAVCVLTLSRGANEGLVLGMISAPGFAFVVMSLVALLLVNAQAVTALTSERDGQTLEMLLVTEISANEFVFGKLGGVLYNVKEVIVVPLLFVLVLAVRGFVGIESTIYVVIGYLTLVAFAAMLGLHSGMTYEQSRQAITNSLGTMFFLFVGVFVCMMLIVEARSSLAMQLAPFSLIIGGGFVGLWTSLARKNNSPALVLTAALLPFVTFYSITNFLLNSTLGVCLPIVAAYGFATLAMLVPAVSAFDMVVGRASADRG